mmetsp:Transcript_29594/g.63950  ORF Transcript_29594/g.63950 Transcript_29594/m.63950 type:complete len:318 (-) Transcript_29594:219-1172(-)
MGVGGFIRRRTSRVGTASTVCCGEHREFRYPRRRRVSRSHDKRLGFPARDRRQGACDRGEIGQRLTRHVRRHGACGCARRRVAGLSRVKRKVAGVDTPRCCRSSSEAGTRTLRQIEQRRHKTTLPPTAGRARCELLRGTVKTTSQRLVAHKQRPNSQDGGEKQGAHRSKENHRPPWQRTCAVPTPRGKGDGYAVCGGRGDNVEDRGHFDRSDCGLNNEVQFVLYRVVTHQIGTGEARSLGCTGEELGSRSHSVVSGDGLGIARGDIVSKERLFVNETEHVHARENSNTLERGPAVSGTRPPNECADLGVDDGDCADR